MSADTSEPTQLLPKRRSLHTIVGDMLAVIDDADGEVTAAIDELGLQFDVKVQAYCGLMRQLAAEGKALEELSHEYKLRAAARETQIVALKFRLDQAMQSVGLDKCKTDTATVYYQSSKAVVIEDEAKFLESAEDRFVVVKQYPNKTALKEVLETGEVVEGAEIKTSRHLRFR